MITPAQAINALLALGWPQAKIAERAGITQPTIARIREGAETSWDHGNKIINVLKVYVNVS